MSREDRIALDPAEITREFERVRRGYDPAAVDHHLSFVKAKVKKLLELRVREPDESYDLVLKATKRSMDEALVESRQRADEIIAEAEVQAARLRADAAAQGQKLEAESRERYIEMGRLAEQRATELASLEREISQRQHILRATASDLSRLANDLTHTESSAREAIAAQADNGIEIVLPVERSNDA